MIHTLSENESVSPPHICLERYSCAHGAALEDLHSYWVSVLMPWLLSMWERWTPQISSCRVKQDVWFRRTARPSLVFVWHYFLDLYWDYIQVLWGDPGGKRRLKVDFNRMCLIQLLPLQRVQAVDLLEKKWTQTLFEAAFVPCWLYIPQKKAFSVALFRPFRLPHGPPLASRGPSAPVDVFIFYPPPTSRPDVHP